MLLFMGGDRNNTEGEQTTKKWEADVHAKRYEKGKTVRGSRGTLYCPRPYTVPLSWVVCRKNHTTRVKRPWGCSYLCST
jgi:hypothetical protein